MTVDHAGFSARLKKLQGDMRDSEFSRLVDVPATTLKRYHSGSFPSVEIAARIAASCGVSLDWLVGAGNAAMHRTDALRIDKTVFKNVGHLVLRIHKEEGVKLPPDALLNEQSDAYNTLIERSEDPRDTDELMSLLPWLEARLRKALKTAVAEPGTGKRQA